MASLNVSQTSHAEPITVSQLNRYAASLLREDRELNMVYLRGEVVDFKRQSGTGHCYFSLRDKEASIHAVMFSRAAESLHFFPENGTEVLVRGKAILYEKTGTFEIQVWDMAPFGIGAKEAALRQLREKLAKKGYFHEERKRSLPKLPKKIGVVTSPDGAALQDILKNLRERYPIGNVKVFPAMVQGKDAPRTIAKALEAAGLDGCDVILLARGGGSKEDLSAFQEEIVADAIFHSPVPVVSAVGHEVDHSIADDVADLKVSTPTAAAQRAVPDMAELLNLVEAQERRLFQALNKKFYQLNRKLQEFRQKLQSLSPENRISLYQERLKTKTAALRRSGTGLLQKKEQEWQMAVTRLEAVSPLAGLRRGYSLVYREQKLVRDAAELHAGDVLKIRFARGAATVSVTAAEAETTEEMR